MKYFIGYLASGDITKYYESITTDLSKRFGIRNNSERVPAHITIVYPFESDTSEEIEKKIENYVYDKKPVNFKIKGFGEFKDNDGTVFLEIESNQTFKALLKDCITELVNKDEYRRFGNDFHPHISIARHLNPETSETIWKYLNTLTTPEFELIFDNISVFEFFDDIWNLKKSFKLIP